MFAKLKRRQRGENKMVCISTSTELNSPRKHQHFKCIFLAENIFSLLDLPYYVQKTSLDQTQKEQNGYIRKVLIMP